jgi:hypothetical protein
MSKEAIKFVKKVLELPHQSEKEKIDELAMKNLSRTRRTVAYCTQLENKNIAKK